MALPSFQAPNLDVAKEARILCDESLGSEFKLSRNSNSVTNKHHQQRRLTQVKIKCEEDPRSY